MGQKGAVFFWIVFAILACVNTPFIVVDLIYANGESQCLTQDVPSISFTLRTWLLVDGYCRIAIVGIFLLTALASICSAGCASMLFIFAVIVTIIYSLFYFAWLIVGAVMFWGTLDKQGTCSASLTGYMYALLIIGFLSICGNCCGGYRAKD